ncbi:MAG TPA: tetratricopeptide repeat protein [Ktedonobacteraceae bacterium]|jgi:tetratricopeptide (TPR) repeat protein/DNA-binding XRE family transcriptional regulator
MSKTRPQSQPRVHLTEARNARRWSQQEVAEKLGTTYVNVSRWERGITRPSPYFRKKLCVLFGKTERELDLAYETDMLPPEVPGRTVRPGAPTPLAGASSPVGANVGDRALYDPSIPLPPAIHLVGRDEELLTLRQRLLAGGSVALTALNGLPGVGKTTLAITLAHDPELRAHFKDGILWAGLGPAPNMQGHLSRWGALLDLSSSEVSALKDTEAWAVALRRMIGSRTMLLVIDDAWRLDDALLLKVGGPHCAHLVTTRFPGIATQVAAEGATAIKELNSEEGMVLLRMLAPQVVDREVQRARELVMAVGGLPLALNLIGNYLRMQSYTGQARRISAALQRLSDADERLNISEPRGPVERHPSLPSDTPVSLRTVIAVTDQQLDEQASCALHAFSVFPARPNSFSEEAALTVAGCNVETLDLLTDTGLLESSGSDRYSLHQTVADYARLQLRDYAAQGRLVTYITLFVEQHRKDYEILQIESNNILAGLEVAVEQAMYSQLTRAVVAFAPFLLSRGLYSTAQTHLQRAYNAAMARQDEDGLASALLYLGEMSQKQGLYEQAEKYLREGLGYARGMDNPDRICALLANLGTVSWKSGDYRQAETYLQEGLTLARELGNLERMCGLLDILGSVESRQGNYAQSEVYLQEALKLARQVGEKELTFAILIDLGVTTGEQGKYEQAEAYLQEGLAIARRINRQEAISALLNNLGDVEIELGNYQQAETYFQEGLDLARQLGQREWISLLLHNLGLTSRKQKNFALSEHYSHESLVLAQQIGIPQITCYILNECGNLYLDQHLPDQAEKNFKEMLANAPEGGQDLIALAQYGLARVAGSKGDVETARQLGAISAAALESMGHRDTSEVKIWVQTLGAGENRESVDV